MAQRRRTREFKRRSKAAKLGWKRRKQRLSKDVVKQAQVTISRRHKGSPVVDRSISDRRNLVGKDFEGGSDFRIIHEVTKRRHPNATKFRWVAKLGVVDRDTREIVEELFISVAYDRDEDQARQNVEDLLEQLRERYAFYVLLALWEESFT